MSGHRLPFGRFALAFWLSAFLAPPRAEDAAPPPRAPAQAAAAGEARGPAVRVEDGVPETTLDEAVVRVTRPEPAGPGAAASVVAAEKFAGEAKSVAELVSTAPGVAVRDHGGLGQLSTASIRGSSSDGVLVLLDGLPLDSAFGGGVDLSTIPSQWISAIEVVRGAEGARFGAGAMGGVLNVVTRRAGAEGWSARSSYGSFDTWSAGADAALSGARRGLVLSLGWDQTAGDFRYDFDPLPSVSGNALVPRRRTNAAAARGGALAKGFLDLDLGRVDLLATLSGGDRGLPGWPHDETPDDWQRDLRAATVLRLARPAWPGATWSAEGSVRHDRLDARLAALGGRTVRQRGTGAALKLAVAARAGRHAVDAGVSAGGEALTADGLGEPRRRPELAAWAADEIFLGRLRVAPAARAERVGGFSGWSASLGAALRVAGPLDLRASAGRTFRAPSFAELHLEQGLLSPNPGLRPEEGLSASAGLALEGKRGMASATAFGTLYRDVILYQAASFQRLKAFNAGKALVRGLELEAASAPLGRLRASGSVAYTLLLSENLRGAEAVVGRDLPRRPRHRLYARAAAAPGPAELHAEAQLVGRQFLDTRNFVAVPRALTFGAGASLRVARRPDLHLHLDVRNLLDDRTVEDGFGNPLPSRMVLLGLRVGSRTEGTP